MPRVFKKRCDEKAPICGQCARTSRFCDRTQRALEIRHELAGADEVSSIALTGTATFSAGASSSLPTSPRQVLQRSRAADLFQHYIDALAPWYDLSDGARHFAVQVPALALNEPLLFHALMSLSAIHLAKTTMPSVRTEADAYHGACIHELIGLNEADPRLLGSGIALAATCLLRSFEILSEDADPNRHLQGAYSLASQPHLGFGRYESGNGTLLIHGFWNYLREDITFSLFGERPLKMDLDSVIVPQSSMGTDHDHFNNMSVILGDIINGVFVTEGASLLHRKWDGWIASIRQWLQGLPETMYPFSRATGRVVAPALPTVRVLQDCHASAWHYFLVALSLLASKSSSHVQRADILELVTLYQSDFCPSTERHVMLEAAALEVCGLAFTANSSPVIVNTFGPISFCARFVRGEAARNDIIRHLSASQRTTGWPVQRIVQSLQRYWNTELGNHDAL